MWASDVGMSSFSYPHFCRPDLQSRPASAASLRIRKTATNAAWAVLAPSSTEASALIGVDAGHLSLPYTVMRRWAELAFLVLGEAPRGTGGGRVTANYRIATIVEGAVFVMRVMPSSRSARA
jgi:hypothetical protein